MDTEKISNKKIIICTMYGINIIDLHQKSQENFGEGSFYDVRQFI